MSRGIGPAACASVLAIALVPAAAYGRASAERAAPDAVLSDSHSPNWSGYAAVHERPYEAVAATWTQPALDCARTPNASASFWVGLDGYTTSTVEQTGTEGTCSRGRASYGGWYEMFPGAGVNLIHRKYPLAAGDVISASVLYTGESEFTLTLNDVSAGWTRSVTRELKSAKRSAAEVIVEAPSNNNGPVPLADFETATFTDVSIDGSPLSSLTRAPEPITMIARKVTEAVPSEISGSGFSDSWQAE